MKTSNIPMYGHITMYRNIALSVYNTHYTLIIYIICLEYTCSVSSPLRRHGLSLRSRR